MDVWTAVWLRAEGEVGNAETRPWSEEHILRKDDHVHLEHAEPRGPGGRLARGFQRGLDPGVSFKETQATLISPPCGLGSQSFLLEIGLMTGFQLPAVTSGRQLCAFPVASSAAT